ncbi:TIM barrel protein [Maioricimonas sp. JC845]|uniref:sugar phosphate isomerase/epimerase family protein n=1 Tax=Maioricimonas sp. JC845 TaxID=3232138 RepID=UPI003459E148
MRLVRPFVFQTRMALAGLLVVAVVTGTALQADDAAATRRLDDPDRLVAWCVVPFDAKKRGPRERAEMLQRLGFRKLAYDWRAEHVPTFEEEILELKQHGIEYFAFWDVHEEALRLFEKHGIHPQIWKTAPSPRADTQEARVAAAGRQMLPLVKRTRQAGCKLGLYNHGGWGGEPANLVAVCRWLRENADADHVGIVYNLHHGHGHIADFAESLAVMQPYLLCLNLNGMNDNAQPKIVSLGRGQHERGLLQIIRKSGYDGPIGLLDHRNELDAEQSLRENLDGLRELTTELEAAGR